MRLRNSNWILLPLLAFALARPGAGAVTRPDGGEVAALIADLAAEDPIARRRAALSLALLGPAAAEAIPALVRALDDTADGRSFTEPVEDVRADAVRALVRIGSQTVPDLMLALDRDDPMGRPGRTVALGAALVLARLDETAGVAAARLRRHVDGPDADLAFAAALALLVVDPPALDVVPTLLARLGNAATRGELPPFDRTLPLCFATLARAGTMVAPHLRLLLDHPSPFVRVGAARVLLVGAPTDGRALEVLAAAAGDADDALAAAALVGVAGAPVETVDRLVASLPPASSPARRAATAGLRLARVDSSPSTEAQDEARNALTEALAQWPEPAGGDALAAIGRLERKIAEPLLAPLLSSTSPAARLAAVEVAVDLGADSNDEAVAAALQLPDRAAITLPPADPAELAAAGRDVTEWFATSAATSRSSDGEAWVSRAARLARVTATLCATSPAVLEAVIASRLADPDAAMRINAARLWLDLSPDDPRGVEPLVDLLDDKEASDDAAHALRDHGGRRMKLKALKLALPAASETARKRLLEAILRLEPDRALATATLFELAESKESTTSEASVRSLLELAAQSEPDVVAGFKRWFARTDLPFEHRLDFLREWSGELARRAVDPELLRAAIALVLRGCATQESETTIQSAQILCVLDPNSPAPIRALLRTMKEAEESDGRESAARAFSFVGAAALPPLRSMLSDNSVDPVDRQ